LQQAFLDLDMQSGPIQCAAPFGGIVKICGNQDLLKI